MTVLIVDDYPGALEAWGMFLSAAGYSVITATDGAAGLELARTRLPDVVVMDLQMPELSGAEVAAALRAGGETRHIPLIAFTGRARAVSVDAREGFDSVIIKPCEPQMLIAEIRRLTTPPTE